MKLSRRGRRPVAALFALVEQLSRQDACLLRPPGSYRVRAFFTVRSGAVMTERSVTREERIHDLVEEVIAGSPHYLVELDVRGAPGSQVVDIYVDSEDELDVDELARISREVGFLMDTEEVMPSKYNLNVSSPGLERPLKDPRQFRKHIGRDLFVQHEAGEKDEEAPIVHGTLTAADEEAIEVDELKVSKDKERRKKKTGNTYRIAYNSIVDARIELPW